MVEPPSQPDYPTLFREHVERSTARTHADVQRAGTPLPEEVREQTLHVLSFALDLPSTWPLTRDLLQTLAPQLEQAGLREDWIPFVEKGILISDVQGDTTVGAELRLQMGILLQAIGEYQEARQHLATAAAAFAVVDQPGGQARALSRAAYIAHLQNRVPEGRPLVEAAMALLTEDDPQFAYCCLVSGMLAFDEENWTAAIVWGERAVALCERHGERRTAAFALNNLSMAYRWAGRLAEAGACGERAVRLFQEVGDPVNLGAAAYTLGNLYITQGDVEKALERYVQAEATLRSYGEGRAALTWQGIARALRLLGRYDSAVSYYQQVLTALRQLNDHIGVVNALDGMGLTYQAMGLPDQARAAYTEALAVLAPRETMPGYASYLTMVQAHLAALDEATP